MPCSQMISMNIRPPRLSAARKLANTPALKARILKSWSRNMGSATLVSITQNAAMKASPVPIDASTNGFVHPIEWWP